MVAAALAKRNGKNPDADTHFPIYRCLHDFIDPPTGIEGIKWLSHRERAAIKAFRPYRGGDETIWPLHQLDILRKHERLLSAFPFVSGSVMLGTARMPAGGREVLEYFDGKPVLHRLAKGEPFGASRGNTLLDVDIIFNEDALGMADYHVIPTLRRFAERVTEIVILFDD